MVQYVTPEQLASHLKQDLDASTANLAISNASALFSRRARTWWAATTGTHTTAATTATSIELPYRPVTAVTALRVNGVVQAVDYTLRRNRVYRSAGFGDISAFPPDEVQIDYTFGYTTVPDDVKGVVLEIAGVIYEHPDVAIQSESIDDYSARVGANAGGFTLSPSARDLADYYRGVLVA